MIIDTADLLAATEVADILGLSSPRTVSNYRARYDDFPEPVVIKSDGRIVLWVRRDIRAWIERRKAAGAPAEISESEASTDDDELDRLRDGLAALRAELKEARDHPAVGWAGAWDAYGQAIDGLDRLVPPTTGSHPEDPPPA